MKGFCMNFQLMLTFHRASFLVLHFSYYTLKTVPMLFLILPSMLVLLLFTKCVKAPDLWQELELVSKFESDLWDTVDWTRKWLLDDNAANTQFVSLVWCNNPGATVLKTVTNWTGSIPLFSWEVHLLFQQVPWFFYHHF